MFQLEVLPEIIFTINTCGESSALQIRNFCIADDKGPLSILKQFFFLNLLFSSVRYQYLALLLL